MGDCKYTTPERIKWYRPALDKATLSELNTRSNWQGFKQAGGHLGLWILTGLGTYWVFRNITGANAIWMVPLLLVGLFAHGTIGSFMSGAASHELIHRTVFVSKPVNDFFLAVYAFFGWLDHVWFRPSHTKHHQVTVHHDHDGEVVLPQNFTFKAWRFWLGQFAWDPMFTWGMIKIYFKRATGRMDNEWYEFVLPEEDKTLRNRHRHWAQFHLIGHAVLALTFILTGHWFLVILFNFGSHYCAWLATLCGAPQHYGMQPDVPDHRLCCRTYISKGLPAFLYWNMQYHIEHHLYPSVPFFNLPKLRKAIEKDLPEAPVGLKATWKQMLVIHKKLQEDPNYYYVPELPENRKESAA